MRDEINNSEGGFGTRIIISPAKKMNVDTDTASCRGLPVCLEQAQVLMEQIKTLDYHQCQSVWKCNDRLTELNYRRFQEMDLTRNLTPAILSYEGIQYQYMAPKVLEEDALEYLQEHLRILSGFYGILKPFDGVTPYRLEMQAKLPFQGMESLYDYWKDLPAETLLREDTCILNLASKEYSKCISGYVKNKQEVQFVTCIFGERLDKKIVEKGTPAKMARGEMVRYLAEQQAETLEQAKAFSRLGYQFSETDSDEKTLVFIRQKKQ